MIPTRIELDIREEPYPARQVWTYIMTVLLPWGDRDASLAQMGSVPYIAAICQERYALMGPKTILDFIRPLDVSQLPLHYISSRRWLPSALQCQRKRHDGTYQLLIVHDSIPENIIWGYDHYGPNPSEYYELST